MGAEADAHQGGQGDILAEHLAGQLRQEAVEGIVDFGQERLKALAELFEMLFDAAAELLVPSLDFRLHRLLPLHRIR